jgi:hypothetical protein
MQWRRKTDRATRATEENQNTADGGVVAGEDETHNPSARKKSQELGRALSREWNVDTE